MAKVTQNIIVQGLSGSLGQQLVLRRSPSGRTIVSAKPSFAARRKFTDAQQAQQAAFREAAAYATVARSQPVYVQKAQGSGMSAYNLALADWFHGPQILDVDLSHWSGQAGQLIRVRAVDDVQVQQVTVAILDGAGATLEAGQAVAAPGGMWWEYTTTVVALDGAKVQVSAQDLPGNSVQMEKAK